MTEASNLPAATAAPPEVATPPAPPPVAVAPASHRLTGLFDPATRRQTLIVAVVLATLFFGTHVLNEALPASAAPGEITAAPGNPVPIGPGWQITPVDGWVASTHDSGSGIRLEQGVVVIDIFPEAFDDAGDLAAAYEKEALEGTATQITTTDIQTATASNGSAARFSYQGLFPEADGAIEGEVTAIVSAGQGVVADAWSPQGDLAQALPDIHQMLDTIAVAP